MAEPDSVGTSLPATCFSPCELLVILPNTTQMPLPLRRLPEDELVPLFISVFQVSLVALA